MSSFRARLSGLNSWLPIHSPHNETAAAGPSNRIFAMADVVVRTLMLRLPFLLALLRSTAELCNGNLLSAVVQFLLTVRARSLDRCSTCSRSTK